MHSSESLNWRRDYKIAVVGGGLVGLATAIFLQRGGFAVKVLEKDKELGQVELPSLPSPADVGI